MHTRTNRRVLKTIATLVFAMTTTVAMAQDNLEERKSAAETAASTLIQELGRALKTSMASNGPDGAIEVCREIAPRIANDLSLKNGWKVTRVGTRVRNSMMGIPDEWEQIGLKYFSEQIEAGTTPADLSYQEVVAEGSQRYFRYMKPIVTQPLCLSCHGPANALSPSIQAVLDQQYPHDEATNYAIGELRGAVSIKQPLD